MTVLTASQIQARRDAIRALIESAGHTFLGVEFIKKDGTERKMNVRLHAGTALLAGDAASDSAKQAVETRKNSNPNLVNVFDAAKKAWRSINLDTVFAVTVRSTRFDVGPAITS